MRLCMVMSGKWPPRLCWHIREIFHNQLLIPFCINVQVFHWCSVLFLLSMSEVLWAYLYTPVTSKNPKKKSKGIKSQDLGSQCWLPKREVTTGNDWCSNCTVSRDVWHVIPSCWNHMSISSSFGKLIFSINLRTVASFANCGPGTFTILIKVNYTKNKRIKDQSKF